MSSLPNSRAAQLADVVGCTLRDLGRPKSYDGGEPARRFVELFAPFRSSNSYPLSPWGTAWLSEDVSYKIELDGMDQMPAADIVETIKKARNEAVPGMFDKIMRRILPDDVMPDEKMVVAALKGWWMRETVINATAGACVVAIDCTFAFGPARDLPPEEAK